MNTNLLDLIKQQGSKQLQLNKQLDSTNTIFKALRLPVPDGQLSSLFLLELLLFRNILALIS